MSLFDILSTSVKFFPKDVITGAANAPGDKFTAMFFGSETTFEVTEHHGNFFMSKMIGS